MEDEAEGGVDVARLRRHVDAFRLRYGIPAIAVRIRRASQPVFDYDSGLACLGRRTPAGPRTLYAIGSITKQFVAAAALELHRRRDVDLAMPVSDMLGSSQIGEHVTLSHLLSHTSGIVYDVGAATEPSPSLSSVLECVGMEARPAGTQWYYCNTNFYLAGHALELVMGVSLSELVQEIIPPDLRASFTFDGTPTSACRATGHSPMADGIGTVAPPDGRCFGSGSAYATASMLVDWVRRLWSGEIVDAESVELMSSRTVLPDGAESDYGMGCFSTTSGPVELSHDGNTAGFSTQLAYYPAPKLAMCVLTNSARHVAEELEKSLREIVLRVSARPESHSGREAQSSLSDLGGWYGMGVGIKVTLCESGLLLIAPSGRVIHLMRLHGDQFAEQPPNGYEYCFVSSDGLRQLQIRRGHKLLASLPQHSQSRAGF